MHLGHGRAVYHLADAVHPHLSCEHCGSVVEIPADMFGDLGQRLLDQYGFAIRPHHFALVGRCSACTSR